MNISKNNLSKLCSYYKKMSAKPNGDKYIFFENTFESYLCLMNCKFITAKALEQKYQYRTIVFNDHDDEQKNKVYEALGFRSMTLKNSVSLADKLRSYIEAACAMRFSHNMHALIQLVHHGVHIGDLIYDHIIRVNPGRYTVGKLSWKTDFKSLQKFFLCADFCNRIFKKYPPKYFIAGDIIYMNGIYVRTAMRHGADVITVCTGSNSRKLIPSREKFYPNYHETIRKRIGDLTLDSDSENWKRDMQAHLDGLFQGKGDINARAAYLGKDILSKNKILAELDIHNHKKNIVIMAHCFTDAPHCGGEFIYNDYYEWLVETLKIVSKIDRVNWILKPHPRRDFYHEEGSVEKLYKKYKTPNLYWMSDQYSTATLNSFADAIVTVGGTAGIEFGCQGIPCVNAGKTFYTGYGLTIEAKSKKQYASILNKMHKIKPLSPEKIELARRILYKKNGEIYETPDDALQKLSYECYMQLLEVNNERLSNDHFVESLLDYAAKNDIRDSYIYRYGAEC